MTDTIGRQTGQSQSQVPTVDHWINGRSVAPAGDARVQGINPADGSVAAMIACGDAADVDAAVSAAMAAGPSWRWMPSLERGRLLGDLARALRSQAEELATLETRDSRHRQATARLHG